MKKLSKFYKIGFDIGVGATIGYFLVFGVSRFILFLFGLILKGLGMSIIGV
jgi:hypothetical protein